MIETVGTTYQFENQQQHGSAAPSGILVFKEHSVMETVRVDSSGSGEAVIRCNACGRKKIANVAAYKELGKKIKVTCPCGASFLVSFEWRIHYRKLVSLTGDFLRDGSEEELGAMEVKNISIGGLGMQTMHPHHLKVGDIIRVHFELDDSQRSYIVRNAVVRNIRGLFIGVAFCDNKTDKALAFYVLP